VGVTHPLPTQHPRFFGCKCLSTSLFISKKDIFKMLSGYPPAFLFQRKTFLKCLVGIHQSFLCQRKTFLNAWWVSTSLFIQRKTFLKCLVGIHQPFFFKEIHF
jgi:hypothetical protein